MKKILAYDLPTRLFHWVFAGLFVGAYFIGQTFDDDSAVYPYHMIMGLILAFAVILRVLWGLVGSRYARFSSFSLNPADLIKYFKDVATSVTHRQAGHNPASSWAAIAMMILGLGCAVTGYLMSQGDTKSYEEAHELFANGFLAVAIAHVLGVIVHTIRHRDPIGLSMIHGQKSIDHEEPAIASSYPWVGAIFFVAVVGFGTHLLRNYDSNTQVLKVFGKTLQLGENELGEGAGGKEVDGEDGDDD